MRGDGRSALDPAELVDLVNVQLGKESAGDPEKLGEVANLPFQIIDLAWPGRERAARLHPVCADQLDLAEFAVADPFHEFLAVS